MNHDDDKYIEMADGSVGLISKVMVDVASLPGAARLHHWLRRSVDIHYTAPQRLPPEVVTIFINRLIKIVLLTETTPCKTRNPKLVSFIAAAMRRINSSPLVAFFFLMGACCCSSSDQRGYYAVVGVDIPYIVVTASIVLCLMLFPCLALLLHVCSTRHTTMAMLRIIPCFFQVDFVVRKG
jgi:hypothetical protein